MAEAERCEAETEKNRGLGSLVARHRAQAGEVEAEVEAEKTAFK